MRRFVSLLVAIIAFASVPIASSADEPFLDLQSIIDEASEGDVIDLVAGTYAGGVVIDKPLIITGHDWPVIDSNGSGTVIEVAAPDVTIENLVIRNSGISLDREDSGISVLEPNVTVENNRFEDVLFGIFLRGSPNSLVIDNQIGSKDVFIANRGDGIRLWESAGSTVEGNVIEGGRDTVFWFTDNIVVRNNQISGGRYGLHFMYSDGAVIEGRCEMVSPSPASPEPTPSSAGRHSFAAAPEPSESNRREPRTPPAPSAAVTLGPLPPPPRKVQQPRHR